MKTAIFLCSLAVMISFTLNGCGLRPLPTAFPTPSPSPTATPTPMDAFTGRLIVTPWTITSSGLAEHGIYELFINPSTGKAEIDLLYEGGSANISPDNSYILYNDYNGTDMRLYDLRTRADRLFAKSRARCVQWSPNSKMFSAVLDDGVLYVYDLSGTSMIIYEAPSAGYTWPGELHGEIECDQWIGTDSFVFQRYVGSMPGVITIGPESSSPLAANTTTLAILGNELALVDSPKRWYIRDVCKNGSNVLLDDESGEPHSGFPLLGDLFLSETFHDFKDIVPRAMNSALNREHAWEIGFIPNSATCELYVVLSNPSSSFAKDIFYIDPITLEQHLVYSLSPGIYWSGVWIGDPSNGIIAVSENDPQTGHTKYISIINLSSGNKTVIADSQTKGRSEDFDRLDVLAWLP